MALTGQNGDNVTNIKSSKSIDFSIMDNNGGEIAVHNQAKPIEVWIAKDTSVKMPDYTFVNLFENNNSNQTNASQQVQNGFRLNGFQLSGANVSIHIQIKPVNNNISYLTLIKFGDNPTFTQTKQSYDLISVFCPNDLLFENYDETNSSFYLIFANMATVAGRRGYVGFSIKEINSTQIDCFNKSLNSTNQLIALSETSNSFTSNYSFRI